MTYAAALIAFAGLTVRRVHVRLSAFDHVVRLRPIKNA